jgi:hypothetical protein
MSEPDWIEESYCFDNPDVDPHWFFEGYEHAERDQKQQILNICKLKCKKTSECLLFGKRSKSTGVFGGEWIEDGKVCKHGSLSHGYVEDKRDIKARISA